MPAGHILMVTKQLTISVYRYVVASLCSTITVERVDRSDTLASDHTSGCVDIITSEPSRRRVPSSWLDEFVLQSLMVPLHVVVLDVLEHELHRKLGRWQEKRPASVSSHVNSSG
jgi:hypothetical protein